MYVHRCIFIKMTMLKFLISDWYLEFLFLKREGKSSQAVLRRPLATIRLLNASPQSAQLLRAMQC